MGVKVELTTAGLRQLRAKYGKDSHVLTIGVHKGATNDVDDGNTKKSIPIAPYAAANEYGTSRIPARPFLRNTMKEHGERWRQYLAVQIPRRDGDIKKALKDVGNVARGDVQATISAGDFEPLSPKTVANKMRKGRPRPEAILIDTGSLIKAIAYKVK